MVNLELWNNQRKKMKISLATLAEQTEISISTIKDIFRGATTDPRIETVQRIERALGLDKEKSPPSELTESEQELISIISQMTVEEVKELQTIANYIFSKRKK